MIKMKCEHNMTQVKFEFKVIGNLNEENRQVLNAFL